MNMRTMARHLPHYLSLIGIFIFAFLAFFVFPFDKAFQVATAVAAAAAYVTWGIVHHSLHKDLYPVVVFEYMIYAVLGLVLLLSVILRA